MSGSGKIVGPGKGSRGPSVLGLIWLGESSRKGKKEQLGGSPAPLGSWCSKQEEGESAKG